MNTKLQSGRIRPLSPPRFLWFPDPPLTRYWIRPRAASAEGSIRWLSAGQGPGRRRMGADSGGFHAPGSRLCRRSHSLLTVPEKLRQRERPSSARDSLSLSLSLSLLNNAPVHGVDDVIPCTSGDRRWSGTSDRDASSSSDRNPSRFIEHHDSHRF